ncbi:hypothetical protein A1O7_06505 [Cladophialophora yegresii CBS 114405]|uniref:PNPLA domain-containing protein n=1 Tax=Cladophialophora yegresii CBS 114405 TaxID=1182544 RepID=W9WKT7_9EURO|nr:uncharacterized protein A1O7_06505 [Cladophialophora yegresii CBS 114405]EXJ59074.1 hypothetical protein A1O7_06505 [Cladophialophora yegresii CBS 114405]
MATTAAPVFFERQYDGTDAYVDGGLGFNSPAKIAYKDVSDRHDLPPKIVISVGTDVGEVVDDMRFMADRFDFKFTRLSVPNTILLEGHCLGDIPLDDWRPKLGGRTTLERLENLTNAYLARAETRRMLEECARELVLLRRQRARTERWETYAMDITYRCCADENCHAGPYLKNRPSMRRHVNEAHGELTREKSPQEVENLLNTCRVAKGGAEGPRSRSGSRRLTRQGTNGVESEYVPIWHSWSHLEKGDAE